MATLSKCWSITGRSAYVLAIDAPEIRRDRNDPGQPYGQASRRSLGTLIGGRTVAVNDEGTDQYGRMLGTIYIGKLDVNAEQIHLGRAWVYQHYSHNPALLAAEREAREARRGLWVDPRSIPPWEYRQRHCGATIQVSRPAHAIRARKARPYGLLPPADQSAYAPPKALQWAPEWRRHWLQRWQFAMGFGRRRFLGRDTIQSTGTHTRSRFRPASTSAATLHGLVTRLDVQLAAASVERR
jgi:hypothetical protein